MFCWSEKNFSPVLSHLINFSLRSKVSNNVHIENSNCIVGTCAIGWVSQEGRCYQFSEGGAPWFLARQACEQQGAQLLVISEYVYGLLALCSLTKNSICLFSVIVIIAVVAALI